MLSERDRQLIKRGWVTTQRAVIRDICETLEIRAQFCDEQEERSRRVAPAHPNWPSRWVQEATVCREIAARLLRGEAAPGEEGRPVGEEDPEYFESWTVEDETAVESQEPAQWDEP